MNIIILSRNAQLYSTQSLIKASVDRGHKVMVIDHQKCQIRIRTNDLQVIYEQKPLENIDAIIPRIGATATQYGSMIIKQFESMGVFTTTTSQGLLHARDKINCLQLLAAHGIAVPETFIPSCFGGEFKHIIEQMEFPAILKLKESTHGLGVILSENPKNLEATLEAFAHLRQEMLVQQFIAEAGGSDIRAFVVDGKVVGAMKRQAMEGEFRSNLHRGGVSEIEELSLQEYEMAVQSTSILGLSVAGVDILRSHEGPMVIEVNASPGLEGIEHTTKVDIAGKIVEYIESSQNKKTRNYGSQATDHI